MAVAQLNLSWKPVQRGANFCAPACGGGCTKAAYDAAVKRSRALAKRMGKGWVPRVWENLGWWYEAHKGVLVIHPNDQRHGKTKDYTAFLNTNPQFVASAANPAVAAKNAIKALDNHIASVRKQRRDIGTI